MAFVVMEPPTALEPRAISEEKNKVFRSMLPVDRANVVRGQYAGYREERGCGTGFRYRDVHRAQGRHRQLALGGRADLPAHRQADGRGHADHLDRVQGGAAVHVPGRLRRRLAGPRPPTFDLADNSKVSLSFYGKRPGPGMKLDKLSMQFSTQEIDTVNDVLEAYERLILDAMRGDHTLFTTAEGIESLWERSEQLLADPPPVEGLPAGDLGTQRDPSADRAQRVAAAVRAGVARTQARRLLISTQKPPTRSACRGLCVCSPETATWPSRGSRRAASAWWPTADGSPSATPGRRCRRCRSRRAP